MNEFFDDKAAAWDKDPKKVERASIFAEEIIKNLPVDQKLTALEFGCGTGLLSFFLKENFRHITLVDNSPGMIEVLKSKIETQQIHNFTPVLDDLLSHSKIELSRYNVVYTLMTLHHIPELVKILTIFKQILLPGGYLCIGDLEKEDGSFHAGHPGFTGHNGFEKEELSGILESLGFEIISYNTPLTLEKPGEHGLKLFPLFLLVAREQTIAT